VGQCWSAKSEWECECTPENLNSPMNSPWWTPTNPELLLSSPSGRQGRATG